MRQKRIREEKVAVTKLNQEKLFDPTVLWTENEEAKHEWSQREVLGLGCSLRSRKSTDMTKMC